MSAIINSLRNLAGSSKVNTAGDQNARFGVSPGAEGPGEGGFAEWLHAMRLVARLPAGVPLHFRRKLWLTLAERHLTARGVDWSKAERGCFRGTAQPDDTELGAQILKDLHRTGCSLFCGTEGRENQAMLRRVLLAYARWNKDVGYCQGFNMIAAIILEVMEKSESDSLKVMIYLVEAVLPEGYFADDLRGLSADMAAFRDLLRLRLPRLAHHMDLLQRLSDGGGVEPPLPDVFTMQWFLTLYATWLPRDSLLRIWDLVLLDGNEVLLLTALAIWDMLQDRILSARSADEFYSCMGGGAGAVYEAGESLVARVVAFGSAPELPRLRSLHRYRVTPPAPPAAPSMCQPPLHSAMQSVTKRGLRLFYSEDEGDSSDDNNKLALATVISRKEDRVGAGDRLSLDIGALKRQYARLRERQRQAHVILAAACARHAAVGVLTSPTSLTVNNLLLGKSAIVSSRGRRLGPPPGAIPPTRHKSSSHEKQSSHTQRRSSETISWKEENTRKSLIRRNSIKWRDIKKEKSRKASIDLDEAGDGVIVSEHEANEMIASIRSRSSSETSSYSSHSESKSSSDTSLCDDNERGSDSEAELPDDGQIKKTKSKTSPILLDTKITHTSNVNYATPPIPNLVIKSPVVDIEPSFSVSDKPSSPLSLTVSNIVQTPSSEKLLNKLPLNSTVASISKSTPSPVHDSRLISSEKSVTNISEYLDSAAGENLRNYIERFETKSNDSNLILNEEIPMSTYKDMSIVYPFVNSETNEILEGSQSMCENIPMNLQSVKTKNEFKGSSTLTELSPIDITPCDYLTACKYGYELENISDDSLAPSDYVNRPLDIIDSFTMYPNFVPDIELSDKNTSDIESPSRSPGGESIIVSEDEPPIPLKIDKYFEHSPEFFGARLTDANNSDIPNRRAIKRLSRISKKPDSLTLQSNYNEKCLLDEEERSSSLPHSHSFGKDVLSPTLKKEDSDCIYESKIDSLIINKTERYEYEEPISPKDYIRSGRKNSERALQIIQENSKILSRILTKQSNSDTLNCKTSVEIPIEPCPLSPHILYKTTNTETLSPSLKESTSDSLIRYRNKSVNEDTKDKNDFVRIRPISIDDPFSLDVRSSVTSKEQFNVKNIKSPSMDCLGNKTDLYGWENKGFLAKCDYKNILDKSDLKVRYDFGETSRNKPSTELQVAKSNVDNTSEWTRRSFSGDFKTRADTVTLPSSEQKDVSTYEKVLPSEEYNYPFSSKYNDFVLSKASDICSKTVNQGPKVCENLHKTDHSQVSDFAQVVTSSISFTYEHSAEDDSLVEGKSNSSDTLCQITSLDQVSTPISPKIFPTRETPILYPKDLTEKSDKPRPESDDTCSAITSLLETDTISSLSYPRSPSTGSYHPFPTRPAMRMPKELGVRLGMYPKDSVNSPPK